MQIGVFLFPHKAHKNKISRLNPQKPQIIGAFPFSGIPKLKNARAELGGRAALQKSRSANSKNRRPAVHPYTAGHFLFSILFTPSPYGEIFIFSKKNAFSGVVNSFFEKNSHIIKSVEFL